MTTDLRARPRITTADQLGRSLALLVGHALRLLGPVALAVGAAVLTLHAVGHWQGWQMPNTVTADDGVWMGVEMSTGTTLVTMRGLGVLVPAFVGFMALVQAGGSIPWLTRALIEQGVTRRVITAAALLTALFMHGFVLFVAVLAAVAEQWGAWPRAIGALAPALTWLLPALLAVMTMSTAHGRGDVGVSGAASTAVVVILVVVLALAGGGPVVALVVSAVYAALYALVMRRVPVR